MSTAQTKIIMLASIDPIARQSASIGLLFDLPDAIVVSHDLIVDDSGGAVRRVITDATGIQSDETNPLDHACLSCTVREDIIPTLEMLLAAERWQTIVLALPLTAAPEQVAYVVNHAIDSSSLNGAVLDGAALAAVVSLVDPGTLVGDLLGDDLLAERAMAIGDFDRRSVGEALASQIEFADVVITVGDGDDQALALLRHIASPTTQVQLGWHQVRATDLIELRHDSLRARARVDPLAAQPCEIDETCGVWTLDLRSARPFHPERLMSQLEQLGSGQVRGRGHFWLPSRPGTACVWDGSGGQLSIGDVGPWGDRTPQTRLVITGIDVADRTRIEQTFRAVVMTAEEIHTRAWQAADDGFEPWLGESTLR